jgi:Uma2 family endonuclease
LGSVKVRWLDSCASEEEIPMRSATRTTRPLPGTVHDPRYPDWMKRPMGQTDFHSHAMMDLRASLDNFFTKDPYVYVTISLVFYYQQGDPRCKRDPDVLVARGVVGKHPRLSFRVWEEGVLPCTLFEITEERTWRQDIGSKRRLYARINIPEYFVFDPEGQFLGPVLRGFRSVNGRSIEMTPNADGSLDSAQLGLRLTPEGSMLRLSDLRTGQRILTRIEQREADRHQLQTERQRLAELDAEIARLRVQLRRRGRRK